jgi:hypothetical protein
MWGSRLCMALDELIFEEQWLLTPCFHCRFDQSPSSAISLFQTFDV